MRWMRSHRFDRRALPLADRHYNRQKVGSPQFVPPGRCVVLLTPERDALWTTSWPYPQYVRHAWPGAWVNSLFRNESTHLASELITEAVAVTRYLFGAPPAIGIVSFVDPDKVRRKRDPGRCYRKAGWKLVGRTKAGLLTFQQLPAEMPAQLVRRRMTTRTYTIANGARRAFGPQVVARSRVLGERMGQVTALNAADAVREALRQWPQLSLATTHAIPQEDVDEQG